MIGRTLGRYRLQTVAGRGGMGIVYRAEDSKLHRTVAIKVLPPDAVGDAARRQRFVQEALAASALNHPGIVTTFDIDRIDDVDLIVMEYVDGEALSEAVRRGPLPVDKVIAYGAQIAAALGAAHRAGIVHRDVKPANIIVTPEGQTKIVDFGLAKLLERVDEDAQTAAVQAATGRGVALGTVAYMSPEQAEGRGVDARSDVFALGVTMFEMLTGTRPFHGTSELATLTALLRDDPPAIQSIRPDVPARLAAVVARCLAKPPDHRYRSGDELRQALQGLQTATSTVVVVPPARSRAVPLGALVIVIAAVAAASWTWSRAAQARRARNELLPEVQRLANDGQKFAAFQRLPELERLLPDDPDVKLLRGQVTFAAALQTDPPGATVVAEDYLTPGNTVNLGVTPIEHGSFPYSSVRLSVTRQGFEPAVFAFPRSIGESKLELKLDPLGSRPAGMLMVPAGRYQFGSMRPVDLTAFWIDQYEVTNADYKKFVDAGGYRRREFWTYPFVQNGGPVSWETAMTLFQDTTGRPGPAFWELSTFPEGKGTEPVRGVSWYEAAAYAAFVGKELPNVAQWYKAAGLGPAAFFSDIVRVSNYNNRGPAPVGTYRGISAYGAYDMAGNVKEWCFNEAGETGRRFILGGAWDEPNYLFSQPDARNPMDREGTFGFRTVKGVDVARSTPDPADLAPIPQLVRDASQEKPVDDETFKLFGRFYDYEHTDLNTKLESTITTKRWKKETVSFAAAYNGERIPAYLFLPVNAPPPYQVVMYYPGAYAQVTPSSRDDADLYPEYFDFIVASGRAVMLPVFKGLYERRLDAPTPTAFRDVIVQVTKDHGRSIDYLESRSDIDKGKIAFYGMSLGANSAPVRLALEHRFRTAVLVAAGLLPTRAPLPEAEPLNFLPRVTLPTLIVNGRQDFMRPYESSQVPFFQPLGTPAADKRFAIYDGAHTPPRVAVIREMLAWFDRYLGPVATTPN